MARNKTLISLLDDLRSETRASLNPSHNAQVRDSQIKLLRRTQERLWEDFAWPHLRVERDIVLQAGSRYYSMPEDLAIDRIERIQLYDGGSWGDLIHGIAFDQYNVNNSDLDQRESPARRWQISEDEQLEIWPIPDVAGSSTTYEGVIRITGIRNLRPLVADSDRADLDNNLIVLYAAAEVLAASGAKDAQLKLSQANKLFTKLRAGLMPQGSFKMFGDSSYDNRPIPGRPIAIYRREG